MKPRLWFKRLQDSPEHWFTRVRVFIGNKSKDNHSVHFCLLSYWISTARLALGRIQDITDYPRIVERCIDELYEYQSIIFKRCR